MFTFTTLRIYWCVFFVPFLFFFCCTKTLFSQTRSAYPQRVGWIVTQNDQKKHLQLWFLPSVIYSPLKYWLYNTTNDPFYGNKIFYHITKTIHNIVWHLAVLSLKNTIRCSQELLCKPLLKKWHGYLTYLSQFTF